MHYGVGRFFLSGVWALLVWARHGGPPRLHGTPVSHRGAVLATTGGLADVIPLWQGPPFLFPVYFCQF